MRDRTEDYKFWSDEQLNEEIYLSERELMDMQEGRNTVKAKTKWIAELLQLKAKKDLEKMKTKSK